MELPVLVTVPKLAFPSAALGFAKLGVFVTLKHSTRSCTCHPLCRGTSLKSDRSSLRCGGPCSVFRPVFPTELTA